MRRKKMNEDVVELPADSLDIIESLPSEIISVLDFLVSGENRNFAEIGPINIPCNSDNGVDGFIIRIGVHKDRQDGSDFDDSPIM